MSSLSEIQAAVDEQRRINRELESQLYELSSGISNAENSWIMLTNNINNTLSTGSSRMINSHELVVQAYEVQVEIEKMYALFKNIEMANKKIRECRNKIYYEFNNYNSVRKIVQAMLNNIEISFVRDSTILKAVEVKHLQLPDYWLTCSLLAIMAWRNDNKSLAQRAIERAYKLDKKNTSMFFFAFHIRIGKNDVAIKWFNDYASCERTGEDSESILLMFAIACRTIKEECSDSLVSKINSFIKTVIDENLMASGYSEEDVINRIRHYLYAYRSTDSIDYPLLSKYCTDKQLLDDELKKARANEKILDFILKTVNITNEDKNNFLNEYVDKLIAKANSKEKEVVNEIRYNEVIIEKQGDIEAAKKEFEDWKLHNEREFSIINEMIEWIYNSELKNTNPAVIMLMFVLTKFYTATAIERNVEEYRSKYRSNLGIKINEYEAVADLNNPSSENSKIENFYTEKAEKLLSEQKIWPSFIAFAIAVLAIVASIFVTPVLIVATFGGFAAGIIQILSVNKRKKSIHENCKFEAENVKEIYGQLSSEFSKYDAEYNQYDSYYNSIKSEFEKM